MLGQADSSPSRSAVRGWSETQTTRKRAVAGARLWPAAAVCGYGPATASTCATFFRQPCKQSGKVKRVTIRKFDGITVRFHSLNADATVWIKPNEHLAAGQSMDNHVRSGHASSLRVRGTPVAYPKAASRERQLLAADDGHHLPDCEARRERQS